MGKRFFITYRCIVLLGQQTREKSVRPTLPLVHIVLKGIFLGILVMYETVYQIFLFQHLILIIIHSFHQK